MPARRPRHRLVSEEARSARRSRKAFASALSRLEAALDGACSGREPWPANVIAGVRAGLRFAATEPGAAKLLIIDAGEEPDGAEVHRQLIESLTARLCNAASEHALLGAGREEVLISAVLGMVAIRLTLDQAQTLPTVTLEAAEFLLSPYLGDERARRLIAGAIDTALARGG
jgi:hypothetical protein